MSRMMKTGIGLEPPERRIGQPRMISRWRWAREKVVLTRAARAGDAPAVASRWLQRLLTFAGQEHAAAHARRAATSCSAWARDARCRRRRRRSPAAAPEAAARARGREHFSVTEIETLRRDPYAIYARRILELSPLDPLIRDPGAAERGTLFHEILHRFSAPASIRGAPDALGRAAWRSAAQCFAEAALPADIDAVWWPRFERLARDIIDWERERAPTSSAAHRRGARRARRRSALPASRCPAMPTASTCCRRAWPTSSTTRPARRPPRRRRTRCSRRSWRWKARCSGAAPSATSARSMPADLAYVRLQGRMARSMQESILEHQAQRQDARAELAEEAWARLEQLLVALCNPARPAICRGALPFREGEYGRRLRPSRARARMVGRRRRGRGEADGE